MYLGPGFLRFPFLFVVFTGLALQASQLASAFESRDCALVPAQQGFSYRAELFSPNAATLAMLGIPVSLSVGFDFDRTLVSLSAYHRNGSGIHLGKGLVLTARHVYQQIRESAAVQQGEFEGREKIGYGRNGGGLYLRRLPAPTADDQELIRTNRLEWSRLRQYNDWALLEDQALARNPGQTSFRRASTLYSGEPLWILGNPYGGPPAQVAVGQFVRSEGDRVSVIGNTDLMPGFSGGPVIDSCGRLVGIVFGWTPDDREASFMNMDAIFPQIRTLIR